MSTISLQMVTELYRHMEWADATVWAAVLSDEAASADEKVRRCFHHLHVVQQAFLRAWRGEAPDAPYPRFDEAAALMSWGCSFFPEAFDYLGGRKDDNLAQPLALPWASMVEQRLGRPPHPTTLGDTMLQVALHSQYHRGQINARLRAIEVEPPLVDYIAWVWLGRPPADWPSVVD